jgi:hypothetical protein
MSMKNSNDTIGNRTRNLPACSAVPRPTAPLCAAPNTTAPAFLFSLTFGSAISFCHHFQTAGVRNVVSIFCKDDKHVYGITSSCETEQPTKLRKKQEMKFQSIYKGLFSIRILYDYIN